MYALHGSRLVASRLGRHPRQLVRPSTPRLSADSADPINRANFELNSGHHVEVIGPS